MTFAPQPNRSAELTTKPSPLQGEAVKKLNFSPAHSGMKTGVQSVRNALKTLDSAPDRLLSVLPRPGGGRSFPNGIWTSSHGDQLFLSLDSVTCIPRVLPFVIRLILASAKYPVFKGSPSLECPDFKNQSLWIATYKISCFIHAPAAYIFSHLWIGT